MLTKSELALLKETIQKEAEAVFTEKETRIDYLIGTMIELPRAALTADAIAEHAQFFSFGTNDLTQTTFGLSRDDSNSFLPSYVEKGILDCDPFVSLDTSGVGELLKIATQKGALPEVISKLEYVVNMVATHEAFFFVINSG